MGSLYSCSKEYVVVQFYTRAHVRTDVPSSIYPYTARRIRQCAFDTRAGKEYVVRSLYSCGQRLVSAVPSLCSSRARRTSPCIVYTRAGKD